ncbi:MAG TPA: proline dehydrogenase family protein [Thermoanaerobaculia bacterium]|nr:proline dehydrogenase family protein [Thermoanaerobaculia bacterium]
MSLFRGVLLAGSESRWLRERATQWGFVRGAVSRFMPGESLDAALTATRALDVGTVLTRLGENVTNSAEADAVTRHYLELLDRVAREPLPVEISIKPTQLGLDVSREECERNLDSLAGRAASLSNWVWVDMEGTAYTDVTLDLYRRARAKHTNVGLCVQAYLYRTAKDLEALIGMGAGVRLVKGAYREPPDKAFPKKSDVDENFFQLAKRLLSQEARDKGVRAIFGTHDPALIRRIEELGRSSGLAPSQIEFQMLYGIRRQEQVRLEKAGYRFRVLISYGEAWFPWYMRRLAERPANVLFVAKNLFGK